jgi:hypothetical protein
MEATRTLSFLDGCVDYQQRFESHAARLFINEENGWDVQFYGMSWADGRGDNDGIFAMWNFDIRVGILTVWVKYQIRARAPLKIHSS